MQIRIELSKGKKIYPDSSRGEDQPKIGTIGFEISNYDIKNCNLKIILSNKFETKYITLKNYCNPDGGSIYFGLINNVYDHIEFELIEIEKLLNEDKISFAFHNLTNKSQLPSGFYDIF